MSTEHRHERDPRDSRYDSRYDAPYGPRGASGSAFSAFGPEMSRGAGVENNGHAPLWPPDAPARDAGDHADEVAGPTWLPAAQSPLPTSLANPQLPQERPALHPAGHAAVAVGTAQRGGNEHDAPAQGGQTLDTPEDVELQKRITTRMAMLQRDPRYQKMQRTLAARRHLRSRLYEFTFLLDIALTIFALIVAQSYKQILGQVLHADLYFHLYVHNFDVSDTIVLAILIAVIWPIVFSRFNLYSTSWLSDRYSYVRIIAAVGVSTLAASGMLYFVTPSNDRTRIFLIFFSVLDAILLVAARVVLRPLVTTRLLRRRVLIVGTGRLALEATQSIARRKRLGLELVGVVGPERDVLSETDAGGDEEERASAKYRAWQSWRIGEIRDVVDIVRDRAVDLVLLALSPQERFETTWVISSVAHLPVQLYVVPDVVTETAKTASDSLDGMPVVGLAESGITGWSARAKRLLDLSICLPLLLLIWPVLLLIAVAVRLDSPGPALFKQDRVGQHNERFKMLKFRTMYVDADRRAREVAVQTAQGLVHKRRDDPRITRLGRILRRASLDELPQLFNIIKGDMSVVGPRPELPWIVERYRAWQYHRLLVPQGLTGWWQVHGRSDRVLHLHTQDDIYYVRNHSFWLDIKILLMTIKVVLTGRGAY